MLSFDDVLIVPQFNSVPSRKDVNLSTKIGSLVLDIPLLSSNMDTVTEAKMANAMRSVGGFGMLHRFCSIEDNIRMFEQCEGRAIVSIGVGEYELKRAIALSTAGAKYFCLDVAHAAQVSVAQHYIALRNSLPIHNEIWVGSFATVMSYDEWESYVKEHSDVEIPNALVVGIGPGSMCTTRLTTGCGLPLYESLRELSVINIPLIANGGCKNSGDIAKALAAGASAVITGSLIAGTDETPSKFYIQKWDYSKDELYEEEVLEDEEKGNLGKLYKRYRGSASLESYEVQGKIADHRAPEGESTLIEYRGSVVPIVKKLMGGLRSAFTYVGASNLMEFRKNADLIEVSQSSFKEGIAYGKTG